MNFPGMSHSVNVFGCSLPLSSIILGYLNINDYIILFIEKTVDKYRTII